MTYVMILAASIVENSIFAYYAICVLNPKKSKTATFIIFVGTLFAVSAPLIFIESLYMLRSFIILPVIIVLLIILFREAYWKRFTLMLSYYIFTLIFEQIGMLAAKSVFAFDTLSPFYRVQPEEYPAMLLILGILFTANIVTVKFIAIPLWQKRFAALKSISAFSVIYFIAMLGIAITIINVLSLHYSRSAYDPLLSLGIVAFVVFSIVFMVTYLSSSYRHTRKELEETFIRDQLALQTAHYAEMAGRYDRLRKLKHDFNNHMQVIAALAGKGKRGELRRYVDRLTEEFMSAEGVVFCGNAAIDAVLFHKRETMLAQGINPEYKVTLPGDCRIETFDLCSIFSNLLDNAIAACAAIPAGAERCVRLETKTDSGFYVIILKNSYHAAPDNHSGKKTSAAQNPKTDKNTKAGRKPKIHDFDEPHGLGLRILEDIAKKYNGATLFEPGIKTFISIVSLSLQPTSSNATTK